MFEVGRGRLSEMHTLKSHPAQETRISKGGVSVILV